MSKVRVFISKTAERDTEEIALHLSLDNAQAEAMFREALESMYARIGSAPDIGSTREYKNSKLVGLRMFPIKGFENHLIFYQPTADSILVVRVLHGARDIVALFSSGD